MIVKRLKLIVISLLKQLFVDSLKVDLSSLFE